MRRTPRKSLAAAGTLCVALGLAGTAWADGAADNTSQLSGGINPTLQADDSFGKGNLFTQVTTYDNDNSPVIPDQSAEVVRIDFPGEMKYTTNSKLAQCDPDDISSASTDAAVTTCKNAYVGAGNAYARIPAFPTTNNETELTVTAFNGLTSVDGDQDSSQVPTGGFDGGNPTIVLHADNAALPTTVVVGEVRPSPNGSDFGSQLNVTDAPDVAADTGALVLFNSQVGKTWNNGKTGKKKKTYNLITAKCDDSADGDFDFRGEWKYDDASTDTDTVLQDCTTK